MCKLQSSYYVDDYHIADMSETINSNNNIMCKIHL